MNEVDKHVDTPLLDYTLAKKILQPRVHSTRTQRAAHAMQLYHSKQFYLLTHDDKQHALVFNRLDASIRPISLESAMEFPDLKLVANVHGFIGRFLNDRLVFIKSRNLVGHIYDPIHQIEHEVYAIKNVLVIQLTLSQRDSEPSAVAAASSASSGSSSFDPEDIVNIDASHCEPAYNAELSTPVNVPIVQRRLPWEALNKAMIALKPRLSNLYTGGLAGSIGTSSNASSSNQEQSQTSNNILPNSLNLIVSEGEDIDKRLTDEMCKLFTDTSSFYYSYTLDLTNSFQRQHLQRSKPSPSRHKTQESYKSNDNVGSNIDHSELPTVSNNEQSDSNNESTSKNSDINDSNKYTWRTADERFFWNKHMLKDLIEMANQKSLDPSSENDIDRWILPILHGFIQLETYSMATISSNNENSPSYAPSHSARIGNSASVKFIVDSSKSEEIDGTKDDTSDEHNHDHESDSDNGRNEYIKTSFNEPTNCGDMQSIEFRHYQLGLISRRSVYRAGTRYKRRGCDEHGKSANFVETEQIFRYGSHFISFVMIRGSIPVFWSQPGFKYRPAPVLHRTQNETHEAFTRHFNELFYYYGNKIVIIDLTEQSGREAIVNQEFQRHCRKMASPHVTYESFDFHRHCRGRRLMQVEQQLANNSGINNECIKAMRYFWYDARGMVCEQRGVFRVNCIDCLDRTNIVQQSIALQVVDIAMVRLGLVAPDANPETNQCRRIVQSMWANNGDVLSRQYAGSNALKGDFTRTGERKLTGYIKDTYSSASRYYISKFRDAYRQAAIDAMLGLIDSTNAAKTIRSGEEKVVYRSNATNDDLDDLVVIEASDVDLQPCIKLDNSDQRQFEISDEERLAQMLEDSKLMALTDDDEDQANEDISVIGAIDHPFAIHKN